MIPYLLIEKQIVYISISCVVCWKRAIYIRENIFIEVRQTAAFIANLHYFLHLAYRPDISNLNQILIM